MGRIIRNTKYEIRNTEKGVTLILTFIFMVTLIVITAAYLFMITAGIRNVNAQVNNSSAFYLAEAGLNKAVWYLMTPSGSGGQGEDWITAGTTENFGDGNYTMVVERWDFALADNGSSVSSSSDNGSDVAANSIDGDDTTYWESERKPTLDDPEKLPQEIIVTFPYTLTINKVRFLVPSGSAQQRPKDYTWEVSPDDSSYVVVVNKNNNNSNDVTDTFAAVSNVNYLKLRVTKIGGGLPGVRIATLEAIGAKITSTGSVNTLNRKIEQTIVVDDTTETAFGEKDWKEVNPNS